MHEERPRLLLQILIIIALASTCLAAGKIKGSAGGNERGAAVFARDGSLLAWTVTGPSGLYEFTGIAPGSYMMLISGTIVPAVIVEDAKTTVVDQAAQPKFDTEKELWGPSRAKFAQSFVASGTAVTGFSLWRASGKGRMNVTLFEDSPQGKRIAGPHETEKEMVWIGGSKLPAEQFRTTPGKTYCLQLESVDGATWNHSMPRKGDVYPRGIAFYDDVAHPESDLGITIEQQLPGLTAVSARDDLHFIEKGPGAGTCRSAGQTFIAETVNCLRAYVNCGGWGGGVAQFVFSMHEDGPGGKRIGPEANVKMVCDWGSDCVWFPDAVPLTPGKRYYLHYRRADNGPFFSYLSSNACPTGIAYRDGKPLPENFDQLFTIYGEKEPNSITYPYNVTVTDITSTSARISWQTGTAADSRVHFGRTAHLSRQTGAQDQRTRLHEIKLANLTPGAVYLYRVSSHTHKASSRRTYSRIYRFMAQPTGRDEPRFDKPAAQAQPPSNNSQLPMTNPGFENGIKGWKVLASAGRKEVPETYRPQSVPFGSAAPGIDGYAPHSGAGLYGWSYFGAEDPNWREPREDWNREIIHQTVKTKPGQRYVLKAFLLTGDRGSGWGRDSRMRLAVDESAKGLLESFDTSDRANVTQWFATQHQWLPISLQFTARSDSVTVGAEFLQWWAMEASHLYIDEFSIEPIDPDPHKQPQ